MKKIYSLSAGVLFLISVHSQTPAIIGTTTYDYQSYGANNNHLIAYPDGKVSAAWMGCSSLAGFGSLGTYYNSYNGTSWGAFPTDRIEAVKTYSTEMVKVLDHEVVLADDVSKLRVYKNTAIGSDSWSETAGSHILDQWYNMAFCPAGTDDIYVVGQKPGGEDLLFSRSDDGGESWTVSEYILPYTTEAYGCGLVLSGSYQIVAKGSDVYILYGSLVSDLILMHSADKGNAGTWELQATILDFPIDNYTAGAGETTDFDGDGDYDWLDTNDGLHEMIITNDGTVHVFSGRMKIRDVAGVTGFYYDYTQGGIYHWKTGDASATLHDEFVIDWDGDGDPFSGITDNLGAYYYESFTCFPTASYDASIDRIYLSYMMPVEGEVSASNQNYYDLFGTYSDDGGETWSPPIDLTYTAHLGNENSFPSANPMVIDNQFQVMWQQDDEPGTSQDLAPDDDPVQSNNILYVSWDSTRFQPYNPTVDFTFVITPFGGDYSVAFTNLTVDAETYFWQFGDGATSTLENPTHIYSPGVYDACLTAYNHYGEATLCQEVVASNGPVANFTYSGDPTVSFTDLSTGDPTSWSWNFGDGGTSTLENPSHTYATNGTYNVCLTATNPYGSDSYCQSVVIDAYPVADFTFVDTDPTISFSDASTGDPTGFAWSWNFGDGGTSTLENPSHTYTANGTYTVCLTASNIYGSDSHCESVTIDSYVLPVVSFSYTGDPTVIFTDLTTGGPYAWDWDFGDGGSSVIQNPTHTFAVNGTYNVCLTATNAIGSASNCEAIVIDGYDAPEALFTYSGDPVVTFTDMSTNDPTSWLWDFDDGTFSSLQNPVHTYTVNDIYFVCLTVIGPGGADTYCSNIDIGFAQIAPVADFSYELVGGLAVSFTDLSTNVPTTWNWDFGDGSVSSLQNPVHTYPGSGNYTACLVASNGVGGDEVCKTVNVQTGVDQNVEIIQNVYPNPAQDNITIILNDDPGDYNLVLMNSIGQKIEPSHTGMNTSNSISLDIKNLAAGSYYITLISDQKTYICEFIKE